MGRSREPSPIVPAEASPGTVATETAFTMLQQAAQEGLELRDSLNSTAQELYAVTPRACR